MAFRPSPTGRAFSVAQVRELDRITIEEGGVPGRLLMEAAGAGAWARARHHLGATVPATVLVLAGGGNNGGDAFVVARGLASDGHRVRVLAVEGPEDIRSREARENAALLVGYGAAVEPGLDEELVRRELATPPDLVVDGLLGTGFSGRVRAPLDAVIERVNESGAPVLALDAPSGLDAETGRPGGVAIRAIETVTFGVRKRGLEVEAARAFTGEVVVVPLPFTPTAWERVAGRPGGLA